MVLTFLLVLLLLLPTALDHHAEGVSLLLGEGGEAGAVLVWGSRSRSTRLLPVLAWLLLRPLKHLMTNPW